MHRFRARAAFAIAVLWIVAGGCGTRSESLYERVTGSSSYERMAASLTRSREVHDGLDPLFYITATRLTPEWAAAYAGEYARIYYLDPARRDRKVAEWRSEIDRYDLFFVGLYTPDERANDLDKPGTLWSLRLVRGDETDATPAYVRRTTMRPEEIARFFPYCTTWYRGYEVAFPRDPSGGKAPGGTRSLRLVLTGIQGRALLTWD